MNSVLEIASLLIDNLYRLLNKLPQYISLDNPEETYEVIFEIFYQALHHKPFLLNLHRDARLSLVLQYAWEFLNVVNRVVSSPDIDIHALSREMLRRAYARIAETPGNMSRYVVVCDGLSIIDAAYIAYRSKRENMEPFIIPLINPGGATETYKFILEPHSYLKGYNLTLNDIARIIAEKIEAKDSIVFRGYDESIHRLKNVHAAEIVEAMYGLASSLYNKIARLKKEYNSDVVVLSDHGYDVIESSGGLYDVNHFWSPKSLSVIAPLLII